jgi:hypothetical protein
VRSLLYAWTFLSLLAFSLLLKLLARGQIEVVNDVCYVCDRGIGVKVLALPLLRFLVVCWLRSSLYPRVD